MEVESAATTAPETAAAAATEAPVVEETQAQPGAPAEEAAAGTESHAFYPHTLRTLMSPRTKRPTHTGLALPQNPSSSIIRARGGGRRCSNDGRRRGRPV